MHGFIPVTKAESEIIDTWPFQRLRRIKQLGMTYLVYHGAEHTRFGHSLGVMHQASRVFDTVVTRNADNLGWSEEHGARLRQLLRLAALCHDLGHCPFSHAGEGEAGDKLLPDGLTHEHYSAGIVVAEDGRAAEIRHVIREHASDLLGVTPEEIAALIKGESLTRDLVFLGDILSGQLDADRMDYLQRDSIYCGVRYGRFDNDRLVETLTIAEDPASGNFVMAVEEDGVPAVESLLLARYSMFSQVYFHRVRRAYDHHLRVFLKSVLDDSGRYPGIDRLDDFLPWDDQRVCQVLNDEYGSGGDAGRHSKHILDREHYRVAYKTGKVPTDRQVMRWDMDLLPKVREKFQGLVADDRPETATQQFVVMQREFPVIMREPGSGTKRVAIEEASPLIKQLRPLTIRRLLAEKDTCAAVCEYCDSLAIDVGQY